MTVRQLVAAYEPIADEYYDAQLHPTCANFGELSSKFLVPRIRTAARRTTRALEVGAGRSILAGTLEHKRVPLSRITLLDNSAAMLGHSKKWIEAGATAILADARRTGLPPAQFDLIVSSLGDPYNCAEFWAEMRRVIDDSGLMLFTTPSNEWSHRFRPNAQHDDAEFVLRDGRMLAVPSFIPTLAQQREMIKQCDFSIAEEVLPTRQDLTGPQSPKLSVLDQTGREAVLYCFALRPVRA